MKKKMVVVVKKTAKTKKSVTAKKSDSPVRSAPKKSYTWILLLCLLLFLVIELFPVKMYCQPSSTCTKAYLDDQGNLHTVRTYEIKPNFSTIFELVTNKKFPLSYSSGTEDKSVGAMPNVSY